MELTPTVHSVLTLYFQVKDALIERVEKEKPIISKPKIVQIFGKIQPIVDLHEGISQKLADLIENWNEKQCDVAKVNIYELTSCHFLSDNYGH